MRKRDIEARKDDLLLALQTAKVSLREYRPKRGKALYGVLERIGVVYVQTSFDSITEGKYNTYMHALSYFIQCCELRDLSSFDLKDYGL